MTAPRLSTNSIVYRRARRTTHEQYTIGTREGGDGEYTRVHKPIGSPTRRFTCFIIAQHCVHFGLVRSFVPCVCVCVCVSASVSATRVCVCVCM